ncbi:RlpA-like double-psi beta-barrel-protein domain-containing protein-containing protein, partial [Epithele typhae]|uniref:RlpA-like double-psi beta-barrel-protein domain-containing protein-containing protein n=1 Tax=Epithele typhae TaxID=378194 RepID=UPI00200798EA
TFFFQGGIAGACGSIHQDFDFIAALSPTMYGPINAKSPLCSKRMRITNTMNNKTVEVTVADACPTCPGANDLDLSVAAFESLGQEVQGILPSEYYSPLRGFHAFSS